MRATGMKRLMGLGGWGSVGAVTRTAGLPVVALDNGGRMDLRLPEPIPRHQTLGSEDRLRLSHPIKGLTGALQHQQAARIFDPIFRLDLAPPALGGD